MLTASKLQAALQAVPGIPFEGVLHRAVHLRWLMNLPPGMIPQPLFSLAAPASGARFTLLGGPPMLYFVQEAETAYAEANQVSSRIKIPALHVAAPPPTVLIAATVRLGAVLELTDPTLQAVLKISPAQLAAPWRLAQKRAARGQGKPPISQRLGQAIFDSGRFQALRCQLPHE